MNKWKWECDSGNYRLYRFKHLDSIIINHNVNSVFRFQLNSKNKDLYSTGSRNYINEFNWLKNDIYFVCANTAENSAHHIYHHIKENKWNFGSPLDYGLNDNIPLLGEFQIVNLEDLALEYLCMVYEIIDVHRKSVAAISKRYDDYDAVFKSLCKSGDWNKIVRINKCYNLDIPILLMPTELLSRIKLFSTRECELSIDDYGAEENHDMVSTTLAEYRQHQHNHHTLLKLWHLYKFMSYDNLWEYALEETQKMEEIKSRI
jgi:hypothetical protein